MFGNRKFHPLHISAGGLDKPYANGGGKKQKIPKTPNYTSLANQQLQQQQQLNRQTTQANRINQTNPFGSQTFTQDPNNPDKWSSETTFIPELQGIFNNQIGASNQAYGSLQDYLKNINDPSRIPSAPINAGQTAQDAITSRLNPIYTQSEEALRTRLINQGVRPGTAAWDNEFRNFNYGKNDAYNQAALTGINLDNQARQTALSEQSLPLNAIQSYLSGNSVQMPSFGNYYQQAQTMAPDLLGAAQAGYSGNLNAYNANQAARSNFMSGLFGLGGAAIGGQLGSAAGGLFGGLF